jgi:hypothetical protein
MQGKAVNARTPDSASRLAALDIIAYFAIFMKIVFPEKRYS